MKCPTCGNEEAYLGMFDVDCPNPDCRHFKDHGNEDPDPHHHSVLDGNAQPDPQLPNPISPPSNPPLAIANLTVTIVKATPKKNTVEVSVKADGDPGFPDKTVELKFWVPGVVNNKVPCTLSHRGGSHALTGIDANGTSIYTTHWKCNQDGVNPNDPWKLEASIYP